MNKGTTVQFNRQSSIIMSASSPTSAYEKDLKVDKRILEIMISGNQCKNILNYIKNFHIV